MNVLDALIYRGWLAPLAPRLCARDDAPRDALAAAATALLTPAYAGRDRLAGAMANCVRRAAAAGVANALAAGVSLGPKAPDACARAERPFRRLVDGRGPMEGALVETLNGLSAMRGRGAEALDEVLEAFDNSVTEVLPREGRWGLDPMARLLTAQIPGLPAGAQAAAWRDLGSVLSLQGRRAEARDAFEASGDAARALLESIDIAAEAGDTDAAARLGDEALAKARAAGDTAVACAALRRVADARGRAGDLEGAEAALHLAWREAREGADTRAEAEVVETLAHAAADDGRMDDAVTLLGAVRKLARERRDAAREGRALRLAGRLMCENGHPVEGMVMLFQARALAEAADPHVEHPLEHYMAGFQATLDERELSAIEAALGQDWDRQINVAFAAARCRAPGALG